jgi:hypothetical protein
MRGCALRKVVRNLAHKSNPPPPSPISPRTSAHPELLNGVGKNPYPTPHVSPCVALGLGSIN